MTEYAYTLGPDSTYTGSYPTLEEAKKQACADLRDRADPGTVWHYYVAETQHPIDAITKHESSYERIGEIVYDKLEELCYDELMGEDEHLILDKDQLAELGKLVCDFMKREAKVGWFGVEKIQTFTYTVPEEDA